MGTLILKSSLEQKFLDQVDKETPRSIADNCLINLDQTDGFVFTITKDQLRPVSDGGLGLWDWFYNYENEAKFSTAGIRGLQNVLYPWDTRYPINLVGMLLATLGKTLVAKDHFQDIDLRKIAASEVRYNSKLYVELISRIQAAYGISTYVTEKFATIPVWLISYLVFMLDLYGGEYVTSSHAISKKNATKDLNFQGSQYIPEESMLFVNKIREVLTAVERDGQYQVQISSKSHPRIDQSLFSSINNGVDLYVEYLKQGIATNHNLALIRSNTSRVVIDSMGGCMNHIMRDILKSLGIEDRFEFLHTEEDPFFHGIGKIDDVSGKILDLGCDTTIMNVDLTSGKTQLPVLETMQYGELLRDHPVGTVVLMIDLDGDRLVTGQIEPKTAAPRLVDLGIVSLELDSERVFTLYTPNQSFLMTFDFQANALKEAGLWDQYDWFIIKTTASAMTWSEWARANQVPVISTPVGFKEIATVMQKIESQLSLGLDVVVTDVFGTAINLGKNPRLLFAGEESGGEIFGSSQIIQSLNGKSAISMREKSAGEAVIITSALAGYLSNQNRMMSSYLEEVYLANNILAKFDIRVDVRYYNENEPDIQRLLTEKKSGLQLRTQNDLFFLSMALGLRDKRINMAQVREILMEAFPELEFGDLENVFFVGDGTYLEFSNKFVEVRPSGTDAVNKAYVSAPDRLESVRYAQAFANYLGVRTPKHLQYITNEDYDAAKEYSLEILEAYQRDGLDTRPYTPPKSYKYLDEI